VLVVVDTGKVVILVVIVDLALVMTLDSFGMVMDQIAVAEEGMIPRPIIIENGKTVVILEENVMKTTAVDY